MDRYSNVFCRIVSKNFRKQLAKSKSLMYYTHRFSKKNEQKYLYYNHPKQKQYINHCEIMEVTMFIRQVITQLKKMSENEKDEWILSQAKLLDKSKQSDFLLSLSGEKRLIDLPSLEKIEDFCKKVENGEIYVEYETHYYEFDDDGHYMDDWKVWHNDPFKAIPFVNKVLAGCHDLLLLEDYQTAVNLFECIVHLSFKCTESPDSEDSMEDEGERFTLSDAASERILSFDLRSIGKDWITALIRLHSSWDSSELAEKLIEVFKDPVGQQLTPSLFLHEKLPEDLFFQMIVLLKKEINDDELVLKKIEEKKDTDKYYYLHKNYRIMRDLKRKKELLLNIQYQCITTFPENPQKMPQNLEDSWKAIKELFDSLDNNYFKNSAWQLEEIKKISEDLIKRENLLLENWEIRKKVLSDILKHNYYCSYSCHDLMSALEERLYTHPDEELAFAGLLNEYESYKERAAYLYHQCGQDEPYMAYLRSNLGSKSKTYVDLVHCCHHHHLIDEARNIAEQGLKNCKKDDLTELFIYLLVDAQKNNAMDKFKSLYASAKRRKMVNIKRIEQALK